MTDLFDALIKRGDVERREPATKSSVDTLLERFGSSMPHALVELLQIGGLSMDRIDAHILNPDEILDIVGDGYWMEGDLQQGLLPILDDHQSNYIAFALRPPLIPRVLYVIHDMEPRVLYRNIRNFVVGLETALDLGDRADLFFCNAAGDYGSSSARDSNDREAAKLLLATDGSESEWDFAVQLLDATDLSEWNILLNSNHYLRRQALTRMQTMNSPEIRELLQRDKLEFELFVRTAVDAATNARLPVGAIQEDSLQVGGKWMDLSAFYCRRHIPNAIPRMLDWFSDLVARRNPHNRDGNYMKD